jgi:hypothetical protein
MSTIAGLKNSDIQKHAVIKLLDAFDLDIDPSDGRIYFPDDPEIQLRVNEKILCVDIGKQKKSDYSVFNPIIREDHAQYLMQLAIYTRIFAGELTESDATEADYTLSTAKLREDENGAVYPVEMTDVDILDNEYRVCGHGLHEEEALATVFAVLDYLNKVNFITETLYNELLVIFDSAYAEYKRLQELGAFSRKQEIWNKEQLFKRPDVIEDDSETFDNSIYDIPIDLDDEEEELEWTSAELNVELNESDFEKSEKDEWIESDFSDNEVHELFGWIPDDPEIQEIEAEFDETGEDFNDSIYGTPTVRVTEIEVPAGMMPMTQINTMRQQALPAPEIIEEDYTAFPGFIPPQQQSGDSLFGWIE